MENRKICTHPSNQGQDDSDTVGEIDVEVEQEDGDGNGQDLLAVRRYRHREGLKRERPRINTYHIGPRTLASTALTPVFLFAEKLTTFNPKAIIPLMNKANAFSLVISLAPYRLTRSSSPDHQP